MSAAGPLLYLAYGSNLHPVRLRERVPSAVLLGSAELVGWLLRFHKRSDADGSAKCDLVHTGMPADRSYGAVYRMNANEQPALDAAEGSGYRHEYLDVMLDGAPRHVFLYLAEDAYRDESLAPFDWYKHLVLSGAYYLGLPRSYLSGIEQTVAVPDTDAARRRRARTILGHMEHGVRNGGT